MEFQPYHSSLARIQYEKRMKMEAQEEEDLKSSDDDIPVQDTKKAKGR